MAIESIQSTLQRLPSAMEDYESPAEECLGERLRQAISPGINFQAQVWVETSVGRFRLDLLLVDTSGRRIAIEVDGKDFHNAAHDHWRTVFILAENHADIIYRVSARHLKINLIGVLAGLASVEPNCFRETEAMRWRTMADAPEPEPSEDQDTEVQWDNRRNGCGPGTLHAILYELRQGSWERSSAFIHENYVFAKSTGLTDLHAIQHAWCLENPPASSSDSTDDTDCFET